MSNVVRIPLVARSFSTRLREGVAMLEPVAVCTSYVLGYVKSQQLKTA